MSMSQANDTGQGHRQFLQVDVDYFEMERSTKGGGEGACVLIDGRHMKWAEGKVKKAGILDIYPNGKRDSLLIHNQRWGQH